MKQINYTKGYLFAVILSAVLILTSCNFGEEVNEKVFVQLIGIDQSPKGYSVYLQLYESQSSNGNPDISKSNTSTVEGSGTTIYEALNSAEITAGKSLFLGQIKMIILGENIKNPAETINSFHDGEISANCPIAYSKDPEEIIKTEITTGLYTAESVLRIAENYIKNGKNVYTTSAELLENLAVLDSEAIVPIIKSTGKNITLDEAVFVNSDGFKWKIPEENMLGIITLNNDFPDNKYVPMSLKIKKQTASVEVFASSKQSVNFIEDELVYNLNSTVKIKIKENTQKIADEEIINAVNSKLKEAVNKAYSESVKEKSYDIFSISKLVRKYSPEMLRLYQKQKEEYLRESRLNFTVNSKIY